MFAIPTSEDLDEAPVHPPSFLILGLLTSEAAFADKLQDCTSTDAPAAYAFATCAMNDIHACTYDPASETLVCDMAEFPCDEAQPATRAHAFSYDGHTERLTVAGQCSVDEQPLPFCCVQDFGDGIVEHVRLYGTRKADEVIGFQIREDDANGNLVKHSLASPTGVTMDAEAYGRQGGDLLWGSETISPNYSEDLYGEEGNDTIRGHAGDDDLWGGPGINELFGDDGDDSIRGGPQVDTIYGGDGEDRIWAGESGDFVYGGDKSDRIWGQGGGDTIDAGSGDDEVMAGTGNDTVEGGPGRDVLHGDDDNDTMRGGIGNDTLYGGDGADTLFGEENDDRLEGGAGNDTLDGGPDVDELVGGGDNDTLYGGAGRDRLGGGDGEDTLYGDQSLGETVPAQDHGPDWMNGGRDADVLWGGGGDDVFCETQASSAPAQSSGLAVTNSLYAGEGIDKLYYQAWAEPTLTIPNDHFFYHVYADEYHVDVNDLTPGLFAYTYNYQWGWECAALDSYL